MNVSLTPELDHFVAEKVSSGRYSSATEVVREALRLLEEQDQLRTSSGIAFNQELEERIQALDRGEFINPEAAQARIEQRSREKKLTL